MPAYACVVLKILDRVPWSATRFLSSLSKSLNSLTFSHILPQVARPNSYLPRHATKHSTRHHSLNKSRADLEYDDLSFGFVPLCSRRDDLARLLMDVVPGWYCPAKPRHGAKPNIMHMRRFVGHVALLVY